MILRTRLQQSCWINLEQADALEILRNRKLKNPALVTNLESTPLYNWYNQAFALIRVSVSNQEDFQWKVHKNFMSV